MASGIAVYLRCCRWEKATERVGQGEELSRHIRNSKRKWRKTAVELRMTVSTLTVIRVGLFVASDLFRGQVSSDMSFCEFTASLHGRKSFFTQPRTSELCMVFYWTESFRHDFILFFIYFFRNSLNVRKTKSSLSPQGAFHGSFRTFSAFGIKIIPFLNCDLFLPILSSSAQPES